MLQNENKIYELREDVSASYIWKTVNIKDTALTKVNSRKQPIENWQRNMNRHFLQGAYELHKKDVCLLLLVGRYKSMQL